jgi:protein SCO1/2
MAAGFAGLRKRLGASLQLVSISIDPEHDRPAALKAWAARFGGDAGWRLYTGSAEDIRAVLEAFDASRGDKSNHQPFTLLRRANAREWVRVDGLASTEVLVDALTAPTASK